MYQTGNYRLTLLDQDEDTLMVVSAASFTEAYTLGMASLDSRECHHFAVSRVLFNSKDPRIERYDVRT